MHGLTGGSWKRSAAPATDAEKNNPDGKPRGAHARVPQLSGRLVTRNRPLSRADVMITGVAPVTRRTGTSQERLCAGQRPGARLRPLTGERLRSSDAGIFARRPLPDWSGRGGPAGASGLVSAPVALAPSRVPQLSRRLVTRNRPLSRADVMITGVAPRYQAHRNFSGAPLRRSAAWRASQTAHRRALEELRRRDLCPKATSGLVGAGRTGRRVWAGQRACGACAMVRPLPHVTRRYGRVPSKVKLWITTSVTRQIPAAGPRATAPGTVTWTYASRPSPGTSRAAEPEPMRSRSPWRRLRSAWCSPG